MATTVSLDEAQFGVQLSRQIWTTKGARFNAHRRLERRNAWSLRAIAFLSAYLVVVTLGIGLPFFRLSADTQGVISFAASGLSLLILVISLLESSRNYLVRAERLHNCAVELGHLLNKVDHVRACFSGERLALELRAFVDEYNAILKACQENHEDVDNAVFRAHHPKDFGMSCTRACWVLASAWARSYGLYLGAIMLPPAGALWALL